MAANQTPRLDLLERDVKILLDEVTRLRSENSELKKENKKLKKQVYNFKSKEPVNNDIKDAVKDKEEREDLAFYIKSQREARNMGQEYFSRLLGTSQSTIANYEKGKGPIENIREMAEKIRRLRGVK